MALPTGRYRAVLLWAEMLPNRKMYRLEFVLENGERNRCIVMVKDVPKVFPAAGFILELRKRSGDTITFWRPLDSERKQPMLDLHLRYVPKYNSTHAEKAVRTGEEVFCDIRPPAAVGEDYEEF